VERGAARQRARLAARDRDGVDVAEQVEGERPAVRRDVHRHPRPFVGREGNLAGVGPRLVDVGGDVGLLLLRLLRWRRESRAREGEKRSNYKQMLIHLRSPPNSSTTVKAADYPSAGGRIVNTQLLGSGLPNRATM